MAFARSIRIYIIILLLIFGTVISNNYVKVNSLYTSKIRYPEYTWNIYVMENGTAKIYIVFRGWGNGTSLIYLPKYENYTIEKLKGYIILEHAKEKDSYYFYDLIKVRYTSNSSAIMIINYTFQYATLILGDDAWFMTPLIGASDNSTVRVNILLTNFGRCIKEFPHKPKYFDKQGTKANITYVLESPILVRYGGTVSEWYLSKGARICINYKLQKEIPIKNIPYKIDDCKIIFKAPGIYRDFIDELMGVFRSAKPILEDIFNDFPKELEVKFFLPDLIELSKLGFIYSSVINLGESGPINLNLALTRFMPGYKDQVLIHEYIHVALGRIGIKATPQLRWFHEGMAEYLSFYVCKKLNINVSDMERRRLEGAEEFKKLVSPNLGVITNWHSGPLEGLYYSAAYYVVKRIGDKYGGVEFYKKLFEEVRRVGEVKSTSQLIKIMARVGGRSIFDDFREMGFVVKEEISYPLKWEYMLVLVVLLVIIILYIRARERTKEEEYTICPFCKAKISKDATICNYCGRIVRTESTDLEAQ